MTAAAAAAAAEKQDARIRTSGLQIRLHGSCRLLNGGTQLVNDG
jgi:hypothetical protein